MSTSIYTSKEQPWKYGDGYSSYRIEIDLSDRYRAMQRHIWTTDEGTIEPDEWIWAGDQTPEGLLSRGYQLIAAA